MFTTIRCLLRRNSSPRRARPVIRCRPKVEGLEDRAVPAVSGLTQVTVLPFTPSTAHAAVVHHHHHHHAVVHHHHGHHATNVQAEEAMLAAMQGPGMTTATPQSQTTATSSSTNSGSSQTQPTTTTTTPTASANPDPNKPENFSGFGGVQPPQYGNGSSTSGSSGSSGTTTNSKTEPVGIHNLP